VRGFTLQHAATNWAPPSSEQTGIIGTNWSKGWIIENNLVQFSKCAGIALGKYGDGTDNTNDAGQADPYTACVRSALKNGWNKATIGSHIVRNNHIRHCEQTGVVGSMGCAFSTVTGNEIHDIHVRRLFTGAEMGGIKFHAAVDAEISNNHIYRCGGVAGLWLDWMAQGTRVIGNLMHDNDSAGDIFLEVNHGPFLLANNLLLSRKTIDSMSNGGAYVHNLTAGSFVLHPEPRRNTPTLVPHGTEIANLLATQVGDDRWFNNIIANSGNLAGYDAAPLPVFMGGNVFLNGGKPSKHEANPSVAASPVAVKFTRDSDGTCWLELPADPAWSASPRKLVTTELLGKAALPGQAYEMPDGAPLAVDSDYFGKPRNKQNPTPGPIEMTGGSPQKFKVWPK
jgi:alpha-N-arabinofuranosidase